MILTFWPFLGSSIAVVSEFSPGSPVLRLPAVFCGEVEAEVSGLLQGDQNPHMSHPSFNAKFGRQHITYLSV